MNKYLLLEIALNEFNHISKNYKYEIVQELNAPYKKVLLMGNSKEPSDEIAELDKIESFTVGDGYILLNKNDGPVIKLDENDADWIKVGEQVI
jgi:hypothetical protein